MQGASPLQYEVTQVKEMMRRGYNVRDWLLSSGTC
jgi:hypothetical protein